MAAAKPNELRNLSLRSLLGLLDDVPNELERRGVIRSRNIVGDYAEWLTSKALGLQLESKSQKGFDALDSRIAMRYSIKGCRKSPGNPSRQLSIIRDLESSNFDSLVGVIFGSDFLVKEAYRMPHEVVKKHAKHNKHQNGDILHLDGSVISDPAVENITEQIAAFERTVLDREPRD